MVVLLLNGLAAVWAVWLVGGERQRAERSEKVSRCVKTDSLPGRIEDFGEWRRKQEMRLRSRDLG